MKTYQSAIAFIGNFSPIFGITYIVYIGLVLSWWLILVGLAIASNLIWIVIFSEKNLENYQKEHYKISETRDIGNDVITYFLSYSMALPSILFLPPTKGIFVLLIIMMLVFILFIGNKIMLFNPFLVVFGYYELEVKTENGASFYLISRRKPTRGKELTVLRVHEFIYYLKGTYDQESND